MLSTVLLSTTTYAQDLGIEEASQNLWDQISSAAPLIIAGIFVVSVLMNIGKVMGNDRDYKSFFTGVALFFFGMLIVGAVVAWILNLTF